MASVDEDPVLVSEALLSVRRWQELGGVWRVVSRTPTSVHVVLLTCDAREEMGRVRSGAADLLSFVGSRSSSEEPGP